MAMTSTIPGVIFENWTLTVSGAVQKPGEYTLAQVQALPRYRQNTRHICVEGWDVIGRFGGARLSDFLKMVGADPTARFITVNCADDYYESLDMATALHPQTLLCYEMYEQPLTREHGAPLRLADSHQDWLQAGQVSDGFESRRTCWTESATGKTRAIRGFTGCSVRLARVGSGRGRARLRAVPCVSEMRLLVAKIVDEHDGA